MLLRFMKVDIKGVSFPYYIMPPVRESVTSLTEFYRFSLDCVREMIAFFISSLESMNV